MCTFNTSDVEDLLQTAKSMIARLDDICSRDITDPLALFGTHEDQLALSALIDSISTLENNC